jgi:dihydroorotase
MIAGLADGSIDCIATDHAPHHYDEKKVEFDHAPFGIVGLETAVSLTFDRLVHAGIINMSRMVALLSTNPARILNIPGGTLAEGSLADITILAPDMKVLVAAANMKTRSKNMPFEGWELRGGVAATIVGGRTLFNNPDAGLKV